MGCHVLLYRSLTGICRGDPVGAIGHEQSPRGCDRAESLPLAPLVWALQARSIIVSKSKAMVDLTMALFARFRVNGDVAEIFALEMIT
jgi:hypothetical protein